jgi:flagellar hook assembly protein FlgD
MKSRRANEIPRRFISLVFFIFLPLAGAQKGWGEGTAQASSPAGRNIPLVLSASKFDGGTDKPLRIDYYVSREGSTNLTVYTANGDFVRNLVDQSMPTGSHTVYWDGKDEKGRAASGGIYMVAFTGIRQFEFQKVTVNSP